MCSLFIPYFNTVAAQVDLDLLLNSPTPSPLPAGQEYILELEQLDLSTSSDSGQLGSFTTTERKQFEEFGYVVRSSGQAISLGIDRTQIAFSSFQTAPVQEEQSVMTVLSGSTGFQMVMEAYTALSSVNGTVIAPTRCDSRQTCSPLRAQRWESEQASGWGYNLSGTNKPSDFNSKSYYRPLSQNGEISLIKTGEPNKKNSITMTWRIVNTALSDETYASIVALFVLPY